MNFGLQTASNWTTILPPYVNSASFPCFTEGGQQTEFNHTIPNGGQ